MSSFEKIVPDEETAYDEVIDDLKSLCHKCIKDERMKKIFLLKIGQLSRLIDGGEDE